MDDTNLKQSHALMAALSQNVDWGAIDPNNAQELIRNPQKAGILFARFLNRGIGPTYEWSEEKDIIRFSLASDGTTGEQWEKECGGHLNPCVADFLRSPGFKPTKHVVYKVKVAKKKSWSNIVMSQVAVEAPRRRFLKPDNVELACLIWRKFSGRDMAMMGLSTIIVMHEPVAIAGEPGFLAVTSYDHDDGRGLVWAKEPSEEERKFALGVGYAFVASQSGH